MMNNTNGMADDVAPSAEPPLDEVGANAPIETASRSAWIGLFVLVIVYVLNFVDRNILSILAEDIKRDLQIGDDQLGFLYGTAFGVFYALFGIPLGKLADNWHRVRLLAMGLTLWSLMTALSGFAKNFGALSAARIGVGVGEASAGPAAYSLISDWFPKKIRGTALAIYSSGLYIGGGVSLLIGGLIVKNWEAAYPTDAPMGLAGWQAAFIIVGLPGVLLALVVLLLKEPIRGLSDGIVTQTHPHPFRLFGQELMNIIPPFTLIGAAKRGVRGIAFNLAGAAILALGAYGLIKITGSAPQWIAVGIGFYAVFSWATDLRHRDLPTFVLIWKNPAFLTTAVGYGMVAFAAYATTFWAAPYAMRELGADKAVVGFWIGGPGATAGFLGVIFGGWLSDKLRARFDAGRIMVIAISLVVPAIPLIFAVQTESQSLYYFLMFVSSLFSSMGVGAAAAQTQDLVLPRMRGVAAATFFVATTLIGLALGPYLVGQVSKMSGDDLGVGLLSILVSVPIGVVLLSFAYRLVPLAQSNMVNRARAAGEPI